jgi:transposase
MLGAASFSDDFKRDAVWRVTGRNCRVAEVSQRLGVGKPSLDP